MLETTCVAPKLTASIYRKQLSSFYQLKRQNGNGQETRTNCDEDLKCKNEKMSIDR